MSVLITVPQKHLYLPEDFPGICKCWILVTVSSGSATQYQSFQMIVPYC